MKISSNIITLMAVALTIVTACTSVKFDRYPGVALSSFPTEMQGEYSIPTRGFFLFNLFKKDTAVISIKNNGIYYLGQPNDNSILLSDTVVLSKLGKYYALSQRIANNPPMWQIDIWSDDKNTITVYPIDAGKNYINQLLVIMQADLWVLENDTFVKTNSTPQTRQRLIQSNMIDTAVIVRMNEQQLEAFIEKHLTKEKAFTVKRVKP
jgi:hypothetical protein